MKDLIRVFVGGGLEHQLCVRVLESSIKRRTDSPISVIPLLAVEENFPIRPDWKRKGPTSFSFQRFLIPAACGYEGKAIYCDSDQIVLGNIAELWNTPFPDDANVLTTGGWQSAVMLIDCARARWNIDELLAQLDAGKLRYRDLSSLRGEFARVSGTLNPLWNCMDQFPDGCRLLHYTGMRTQPWLTLKHPLGYLWAAELKLALHAGTLSVEDVQAAIDQQFVRPSLALSIGREPKTPDEAFVFPDDRRKAKA